MSSPEIVILTAFFSDTLLMCLEVMEVLLKTDKKLSVVLGKRGEVVKKLQQLTAASDSAAINACECFCHIAQDCEDKPAFAAVLDVENLARMISDSTEEKSIMGLKSLLYLTRNCSANIWIFSDADDVVMTATLKILDKIEMTESQRLATEVLVNAFSVEDDEINRNSNMTTHRKSICAAFIKYLCCEDFKYFQQSCIEQMDSIRSALDFTARCIRKNAQIASAVGTESKFFQRCFREIIPQSFKLYLDCAAERTKRIAGEISNLCCVVLSQLLRVYEVRT